MAVKQILTPTCFVEAPLKTVGSHSQGVQEEESPWTGDGPDYQLQGAPIKSNSVRVCDAKRTNSSSLTNWSHQKLLVHSDMRKLL